MCPYFVHGKCYWEDYRIKHIFLFIYTDRHKFSREIVK